MVEEKEVKHINESVMFDFDSDLIREDQKGKLDDVAKFMEENPDALIVLDGYASTEGAEGYNTILSLRRATSVENALTDRGVESASIKTVDGKGETSLFGDLLNLNRRVVIITIDE